MNARPDPNSVYTIIFYNSSNQRIATRTAEAQGFWEACLHGHAILFDGSVAGAEEFDIIEPPLAA
nr:hypothetical protein [uncultured Cohaesibacter sp.]